MTIQDLGSLGEFIAAVATVATLVYLAIQIRQNSQSVQTASEVSVSQKAADWLAQAVNDPSLGRIWDIAATDPDSLNEDEVRRFIWYVAEYFMLYEGQYSLYAKGYVSSRTWEAKAKILIGLLRNPLVSGWWDSEISAFTPEFFDYVESRRTEKDIAWTHRSVYDSAKSDR